MTHTRRPLAARAASALLAPLLCVCLASGAQPEPDPLRGPTVSDDKSKTLVHEGMMREFDTVEGRPESAALELLDLDEQTAEAARAVVDARSTELAMVLVDEIDAVREMTDQQLAGDTDAARETLLALWERFEPGRPRSPLLDDLSEIIGEANTAEMRRLLDEYWEAWIKASAGDDEMAGDDDKQRLQNRLAFGLFQQEVREAYDISLRRYRDALEAIYNAVEPTTEQRAEIRSIVIEHIRNTRLDPTITQRREAMTKIYRILDDDRRERLFNYMVEFVVREG